MYADLDIYLDALLCTHAQPCNQVLLIYYSDSLKNPVAILRTDNANNRRNFRIPSSHF